MCGVAGFIDRRAATAAAALESTARAMAGTLRLRGPDDSGTWTDEAAGIALGHRRLSIERISNRWVPVPLVSRSDSYPNVSGFLRCILPYWKDGNR